MSSVRPIVRPRGRAAAWRSWVAAGNRGLVVLALLVGVGAGLGAIAFRELIEFFTHLFTGHADYAGIGRAGNPDLGVGGWFVVLTPVVGGLVYGPLVARFAPEARGHGVPEVMLAVARGGGRIRPQVPAVKALASAICIGSGGSVGREGPIVQIGSALGSVLGQVARVSEDRLRLLVACGAAGGIAATFNAPIAGVFFALEVILRDFAARAFAVVVLSAVVADAIARQAFGSDAFLSLPALQMGGPGEYALYVLLGVLAAFAGVAFIRVLYGGEDLADRVWRGPEWLRPAVGGILLGGLLFAVPQMYGVGYPVLEGAIRGHEAALLLIGLLVAKMVATTLTIAIGGSGGVFAPSLFMGAMLGSSFGAVAGDLIPGLGSTPGAFGLVGMGAVFAAAARAPISAVLIIFELTGEYGLILPLMCAVAVAVGVAQLISKDKTIYSVKLQRRGIELGAPGADGVMGRVLVRTAMSAVPAAVDARLALSETVDLLARAHGGALPVVGAEGFVGVITSRDAEQAMREGRLSASAGSVAHATAELRADQPLTAALDALAEADDAVLPVLGADESLELVGWISHRDVLLAYRDAASAGA